MGDGPITRFDASRHDVRIAAEVKDFDPLTVIDRKLARRTDRFTHFALAAALEAQADAKLDIAPIADEVGVLIGSGSGGLWTLEQGFHQVFERPPDRFNPFFITMMPADLAGANVSMLLGARGHNYATVSACATGAHAIGEAAEVIKRGDADVMITGGAEAGMTPMTIAASPACTRSRPATTTRRAPAAPSTPTAMALSLARARASSSSKRWNSPGRAARTCTRRSSATRVRPTPTISPIQRREARGWRGPFAGR